MTNLTTHVEATLKRMQKDYTANVIMFKEMGLSEDRIKEVQLELHVIARALAAIQPQI